MSRVRRTHVYTGKYALVGANVQSSRMSVRTHVQLPFGDLDSLSRPIPPEKMVVRNRRIQSRLAAEEIEKNSPQLRAQVANRKAGSLSRKVAWSVILVVTFFFSILLVMQYNTLVQKQSVLTTLRAQIETQSVTNQGLEQALLEAADEVKVRYVAVQNLGMVAPSGIPAIELTVPDTYISNTQNEAVSVPETPKFFSTLFAFLD